eukprot:TRINITY_DN8528_c0_g4_i1.p1 TRINITY_DN8528_c0_g4~~TRINITY_DN8528_c0_g4_i1.p1  ORF type:complete len:2111 (+),score=610.55 TRINITY_DN8528_c0_g4_i1:3-6335(+)
MGKNADVMQRVSRRVGAAYMAVRKAEERIHKAERIRRSTPLSRASPDPHASATAELSKAFKLHKQRRMLPARSVGDNYSSNLSQIAGLIDGDSGQAEEGAGNAPTEARDTERGSGKDRDGQHDDAARSSSNTSSLPHTPTPDGSTHTDSEHDTSEAYVCSVCKRTKKEAEKPDIPSPPPEPLIECPRSPKSPVAVEDLKAGKLGISQALRDAAMRSEVSRLGNELAKARELAAVSAEQARDAEKQQDWQRRRVAALNRKVTDFREVVRGLRHEYCDAVVAGGPERLQAENRFFRRERVELYRKLYGHLTKGLPAVTPQWDDIDAVALAEQRAEYEEKEAKIRADMSALLQEAEKAVDEKQERIRALAERGKRRKAARARLADTLSLVESELMAFHECRPTVSDGAAAAARDHAEHLRDLAETQAAAALKDVADLEFRLAKESDAHRGTRGDLTKERAASAAASEKHAQEVKALRKELQEWEAKAEALARDVREAEQESLDLRLALYTKKPVLAQLTDVVGPSFQEGPSRQALNTALDAVPRLEDCSIGVPLTALARKAMQGVSDLGTAVVDGLTKLCAYTREEGQPFLDALVEAMRGAAAKHAEGLAACVEHVVESESRAAEEMRRDWVAERRASRSSLSPAGSPTSTLRTPRTPRRRRGSTFARVASKKQEEGHSPPTPPPPAEDHTPPPAEDHTIQKVDSEELTATQHTMATTAGPEQRLPERTVGSGSTPLRAPSSISAPPPSGGGGVVAAPRTSVVAGAIMLGSEVTVEPAASEEEVLVELLRRLEGLRSEREHSSVMSPGAHVHSSGQPHVSRQGPRGREAAIIHEHTPTGSGVHTTAHQDACDTDMQLEQEQVGESTVRLESGAGTAVVVESAHVGHDSLHSLQGHGTASADGKFITVPHARADTGSAQDAPLQLQVPMTPAERSAGIAALMARSAAPAVSLEAGGAEAAEEEEELRRLVARIRADEGAVSLAPAERSMLENAIRSKLEEARAKPRSRSIGVQVCDMLMQSVAAQLDTWEPAEEGSTRQRGRRSTHPGHPIKAPRGLHFSLPTGVAVQRIRRLYKAGTPDVGQNRMQRQMLGMLTDSIAAAGTAQRLQSLSLPPYPRLSWPHFVACMWNAVSEAAAPWAPPPASAAAVAASLVAAAAACPDLPRAPARAAHSTVMEWRGLGRLPLPSLPRNTAGHAVRRAMTGYWRAVAERAEAAVMAQEDQQAALLEQVRRRLKRQGGGQQAAHVAVTELADAVLPRSETFSLRKKRTFRVPPPKQQPAAPQGVVDSRAWAEWVDQLIPKAEVAGLLQQLTDERARPKAEPPAVKQATTPPAAPAPAGPPADLREKAAEVDALRQEAAAAKREKEAAEAAAEEVRAKHAAAVKRCDEVTRSLQDVTRKRVALQAEYEKAISVHGLKVAHLEEKIRSSEDLRMRAEEQAAEKVKASQRIAMRQVDEEVSRAKKLEEKLGMLKKVKTDEVDAIRVELQKGLESQMKDVQRVHRKEVADQKLMFERKEAEYLKELKRVTLEGRGVRATLDAVKEELRSMHQQTGRGEKMRQQLMQQLNDKVIAREQEQSKFADVTRARDRQQQLELEQSRVSLLEKEKEIQNAKRRTEEAQRKASEYKVESAQLRMRLGLLQQQGQKAQVEIARLKADLHEDKRQRNVAQRMKDAVAKMAVVEKQREAEEAALERARERDKRERDAAARAREREEEEIAFWKEREGTLAARYMKLHRRLFALFRALVDKMQLTVPVDEPLQAQWALQRLGGARGRGMELSAVDLETALRVTSECVSADDRIAAAMLDAAVARKDRLMRLRQASPSPASPSSRIGDASPRTAQQMSPKESPKAGDLGGDRDRLDSPSRTRKYMPAHGVGRSSSPEQMKTSPGRGRTCGRGTAGLKNRGEEMIPLGQLALDAAAGWRAGELPSVGRPRSAGPSAMSSASHAPSAADCVKKKAMSVARPSSAPPQNLAALPAPPVLTEAGVVAEGSPADTQRPDLRQRPSTAGQRHDAAGRERRRSARPGSAPADGQPTGSVSLVVQTVIPSPRLLQSADHSPRARNPSVLRRRLTAANAAAADRIQPDTVLTPLQTTVFHTPVSTRRVSHQVHSIPSR